MELGVRRRLRRDEEGLRASSTNQMPEEIANRGFLRSLGSDDILGINEFKNRIRQTFFGVILRRIPILRAMLPNNPSQARQGNIDLVFDAVIKLFDLEELKPLIDGLRSSRKDLDKFKVSRSNPVGVTVRRLMHVAQSFRFPSHPRQVAISAGILISLLPLYYNTKAGPISATSLTLIMSHLMSLTHQVQRNQGGTGTALLSTLRLSGVLGSLSLLLSLFSPISSRSKIHAAMWAVGLIAAWIFERDEIGENIKPESQRGCIEGSSASKISPKLVMNPESFLSWPVKFVDTQFDAALNLTSASRDMDVNDESFLSFLSEFERAAEQEDSLPLVQRPEGGGEEPDDADFDEDDEEAISRFDATEDPDVEGDFSGSASSSPPKVNESDSDTLLDNVRGVDTLRADYTLHSFGSRNARNLRPSEMLDADDDAKEAVGDAGLLLEQELSRLAETGYFDEENEDDDSRHINDDTQR
jgi:hypothetical protein